MLLKKLTIALITISALSGTSCQSSKKTLEKEMVQTRQEVDSVSEKVTSETRLLTTPRTTARQNLTLDQLKSLPSGGKYQSQDGNATGTIEKLPDGSLEFTANCDSLTLLVESLTKEVYRYKNEKAELETKLKEEKVVEVNKVSGWQWFQIYGFRIYLILTFIFIAYKFMLSKII